MLLAVKVNELAAVVVAGLKVAVTPAGSPEAVSVTLATEPPDWATLMVLLALPPTRRFSVLAEDEMLKLDAGMVKTMVVVLVTVLKVPFTVTT